MIEPSKREVKALEKKMSGMNLEEDPDKKEEKIESEDESIECFKCDGTKKNKRG